MVNGKHKSMIREGIIKHKDIEFIATVEIIDRSIVKAEGEIVKPKDLNYYMLFGNDGVLFDKKSGKRYDITFMDSKFIFNKFNDLDFLFYK